MIGSAKRASLFLVAGLFILAGCGGALEEPTDTADSAAPVQEEPKTQGEVKAMACYPYTFMGSGSCHYRCSDSGSYCNGAKQWTCTAYNYDHYKTSTGADNYIARWNSAFTVTKCQNTNPTNCPGFCN